MREPALNGIWELKQRNPLVGAFVLVLGIGTFYFLIQSVLTNGYIMVDNGLHPRIEGTDFVSRLRAVYVRYQIPILVILAITEFTILFAVPLLVSRRWNTRDTAAYFRFDRLPVVGVLASAIGVLFLLPIVELVARFIYSLLPGLEKLSGATGSIVQTHSTPVMILVVFSVAVTPAICEETLFRGYLQRTLERKLRAPWHFLLSGTLFALFHQQVLSLPSLLLVGIYLGFVYSRFESIYPGMASHLTYNGVIIWLANTKVHPGFVFSRAGDFNPQAVAVSAAMLTVLILAMVFLPRLARTRSRVRSGGGE